MLRQPPQKERPPADPDAVLVAAANTHFALDLYRKLSAQSGNILFAPYSLFVVLSMAYAGARGETAAQMAQVLHLPPLRERLCAAYEKLAALLTAAETGAQTELNAANGLWSQAGYPLREEFLALLARCYRATVAAVDYHDPDAARRQINDWVEAQTRAAIRDLVPPGTLDPLTRLVLVNAIRFKGRWAGQFAKEATTQAPFWTGPQHAVEVPMMEQEGTFVYGEDARAQLLELPYAGDELAVLILLPKHGVDLAEVEAALSVENLRRWEETLAPRTVRVGLPRFLLAQEVQLAALLRALGMVDAFDQERADFSGIDGRTMWLYISAVLHKAYAAFDEKGTEAAAASAVVVKMRSIPSPPAILRADHSFLFLIRERRSGCVLFLGRVVDPAAPVV